MRIEPDTDFLGAELALRSEARRAALLQKAKGRGLFSWLDLAFLVPVVLFGYLALAGSAPLQRETLAMFAALIMVVQWSIVRLTMRLNALVQYLLDQQAMSATRHGDPAGAAKCEAPLPSSERAGTE